MTNLVFTEAEWKAALPGLVKDMRNYLRPYRTPIYEHFGTHGDGWGSGSYVLLDGKVYILTNEHVSKVRSSARVLAYQFDGRDDIRRIVGDHVEIPAPYDLGLLPVDMPSWNTVAHSSTAIDLSQMSTKHDPAPTELLAFTGFAGERADFHFGHLLAEGTCSLAREIDVPKHPDVDPRFHFGIDYRPDLATSVVGNHGLPTPPGLSGSTVWDTGFVRAKMHGHSWDTTMARVTGVVWGWPSGAGCLVATRAEYVHIFLRSAVAKI